MARTILILNFTSSDPFMPFDVEEIVKKGDQKSPFFMIF